MPINLLVAWTWILLGFVSGFCLGLGFHRENWLGGYASLKRRLYRLGHISLFALGAINLFFYLTADHLHAGGIAWAIASWAFVAGAVSMPMCCLIMAHVPKARLLFAVPVLSLLTAGAATLAGIIAFQQSSISGLDHLSVTIPHPLSR
jgi:hypothetical protein